MLFFQLQFLLYVAVVKGSELPYSNYWWLNVVLDPLNFGSSISLLVALVQICGLNVSSLTSH